ncbi:hypothetical protein DPMN_036751 [Dreissena polymorpha]|uniref:Uncharacterized protein n=1 Tax=Dreissena polymorpha TaxID=45954 RepID=A0A9D4MC52_DREPO|nr:hypothetical protein DPMN_036626 [Dreissena polymorpha]KAH3873514.1 hypothetical protein DPMN_036751 [Dreissena polymorpha]
MPEDAHSFTDNRLQHLTYCPRLRQRLLTPAEQQHPALSQLWECAWHVQRHEETSGPRLKEITMLKSSTGDAISDGDQQMRR